MVIFCSYRHQEGYGNCFVTVIGHEGHELIRQIEALIEQSGVKEPVIL